jgi:hypothetical protein
MDVAEVADDVRSDLTARFFLRHSFCEHGGAGHSAPLFMSAVSPMASINLRLIGID